MSIVYSQFINRYGVRSVNHLATPNIIKQTEFVTPRGIDLHYLDQMIGGRFPNRNLYIFNGVNETKKIKITHTTDLSRKNSVLKLDNRWLGRDIRQWKASHRKTFLEQNLLLEPNKDENSVGVYNHNTILDLYDYKTTLQANYDKNYNIVYTLADKLKQAVDANRNSVQIVKLPIPDVVPGIVQLTRIMSFNEKKIGGLFQDHKLYLFFEIYKWLIDKPTFNNDVIEDPEEETEELEELEEERNIKLNGTRYLSAFSSITDKDSESILLELSFKGYSCFVPLWVFRSMSVSSSLDSPKKMNDRKLRKFFISFLNMIQDRIVELNVSGVVSTRALENDEDPLDYKDDETYERVLDARETLQNVVISSKTNEKKNKAQKILDDFDEDLKILAGTIVDDTSEEEEAIFKELDKYNQKRIEAEDEMYGKKKNRLEELGDIEESDSDIEDEVVEINSDDSDLEEVDPNTGVVEPTITPVKEYQILNSKTVNQLIDEYLKEGEQTGTITSPEIRSLRKAQEVRTRLLEPYTYSIIDDFTIKSTPSITLENDKIKIPIKNDNVPENLKTDKMRNFDKLYVKKHMKEDIVSSLVGLEKAGSIITEYTVDKVQNSVDKYEIHKITFRPLIGKVSTVYFRIPIVDSEGTFMVTGKKYRMRKLKQDLPIRKISQVRVALTSNYGKFFISRSLRKSFDRDRALIETIRNIYLDDVNGPVRKIVPGLKRMNLSEGLPNTYYYLSSVFDSITIKTFKFIFVRSELENVIKVKDIEAIEKTGRVVLGYNVQNSSVISMGQDGRILEHGDNVDLGTTWDLLDLPISKVPKSFSVMKVMGLDIPLGVVLSYYMGLYNLIAITNTKYKSVPLNKRYRIASEDELELRFGDRKIILLTDTEEKKLIFNGFLFYKDFIKDYPVKAFDNKDIYLNLVMTRGASLYHLKELEILERLFIDPITKSVLEEMKEPTEYMQLLFRANEMLKDYAYPDINDPTYCRIRGYDRFAGLMYRALSESMREHYMRGRTTSKISLDPYKVWNYITQDSSIQARESLNPVANIKEDEIVTFSGLDGLKSDAVPKELRRFHNKDSGLFTEGTSDSKDVALTTSLSPYAKITNLRGFVADDYSDIEENPAKVFSSAIQISPMSEYDD